jgi:glutamate dehydrogenase/leucine dehydrogenase
MTSLSEDATGLRIQTIAVDGYEDVRICEDPSSGLQAIIAIHDTTLGPALGGTRFKTYPDRAAALLDVMRLSEGMTYKAAAAELDLGGGKAVILGEPTRIKTPELLHAYGRFVDSLGGRYITAADFGTTSEDLDVIGGSTAHVVGRTTSAGGLGDTGHSTALGVLVSMKTAVAYALSRPLADVTVGVEGMGKVGVELISLLRYEGARVVASDPSTSARARVHELYPEVELVEDLFSVPLDVYAPCALGGTVTPTVADHLAARLVCGAANNQLSSASVEARLGDRGIIWVPDFVANAGGLIQASAERHGATVEAARQRIRALDGAVRDVLTRASSEGITPGQAAMRLAEDRIAAARGGRPTSVP